MDSPATRRLQVATVPEEGRLVVIVGPSGSGKDTLIDWLRRNIAPDHEALFVQRVITRAAGAGGEDHHAVTVSEFAAMRARSAFAVTWEAHGLSYGIPRSVADHVRTGGLAIVNGSRQALPLIHAVFANTQVVLLTVEPGELARRLGERGRETIDEIRCRLERAKMDIARTGELVEIDNTGPVDVAGQLVLHLIGCG